MSASGMEADKWAEERVGSCKGDVAALRREVAIAYADNVESNMSLGPEHLRYFYLNSRATEGMNNEDWEQWNADVHERGWAIIDQRERGREWAEQQTVRESENFDTWQSIMHAETAEAEWEAGL